MCTVILWHHLWPQTPLVVAANRDEQLARRAEPPRWTGDVLAPRDLQAGGTWMGVTRAGRFVGLTNRFLRGPPDTSRRSRGELVTGALTETGSVETWLRSLDARAYNGFHLVCIDGDSGWLVIGDGAALTVRVLTPGVHVLTERSFDAGPTARVPVLEAQAAAIAESPSPPTDDVLRQILARHAEPSFDGTCVHWDAVGYGTRSSALIRRTAQGWDYRHAEGPPCQTPYSSYGDLTARPSDPTDAEPAPARETSRSRDGA